MDTKLASCQKPEGSCRGLFFKKEACDQWLPQRSVLGPLLFVIYINDLDDNMGDMFRKLADDTEIGAIVDSEECNLRLQQDLNRLGQ